MDVREKLIELIAKAKYICANDYSDHTEDEYIADTLLDNGVTVQEWISVNDRLPEPKHEFDARNWYLVALSNGVVKELAYEFHNHSVFGYGWRETAYPVTHWMPLPEMPKGE